MGPFLLETNYIAPVWSGTRVNRIRGLNRGVAYGEAFDVSAHRGLVNVVKTGPFAGTPLDRLVREHHDELVGDLPDDGVVQVVLMDAAESLSVQVHPDEAYAAAHEDDHEKTEAWYILAADPGATIICGSTTSDVSALRAAAADDTIGARFGRKVPVSEGDFVLIPAGTLHALGAGVLALEVGSLGFVTYRICDWGRGRELHVEKGFDVLRAESRPEPRHFGLFDPRAEGSVRSAVRHRLYSADVVDVREPWRQELDGRYQVISCVAGTARVTTPDGAVELAYTRSCIVPASAGGYVVEGPCRIIRSRANRVGEVVSGEGEE